MKELSPRMLEGAIHPREGRELGLVAEIPAPDGIDIVGGARYLVLPDEQTCKFADEADSARRVVFARSQRSGCQRLGYHAGTREIPGRHGVFGKFARIRREKSGSWSAAWATALMCERRRSSWKGGLRSNTH